MRWPSDKAAQTAHRNCMLMGIIMVTTVDVREMWVRLAELLGRAEHGETVVIIRSGREVARLGPPLWREQRRPGRMKGRTWSASDWDQTPAELIDAMEGKGEAW